MQLITEAAPSGRRDQPQAGGGAAGAALGRHTMGASTDRRHLQSAQQPVLPSRPGAAGL